MTFVVRDRAARTGRNPQTGATNNPLCPLPKGATRSIILAVISSVPPLPIQTLIFSILKYKATNDEEVVGDGVLDILQEGYGFLRSTTSPSLNTNIVGIPRTPYF
jgi:hypothetical protein